MFICFLLPLCRWNCYSFLQVTDANVCNSSSEVWPFVHSEDWYWNAVMLCLAVFDGYAACLALYKYVYTYTYWMCILIQISVDSAANRRNASKALRAALASAPMTVICSVQYRARFPQQCDHNSHYTESVSTQIFAVWRFLQNSTFMKYNRLMALWHLPLRPIFFVWWVCAICRTVWYIPRDAQQQLIH